MIVQGEEISQAVQDACLARAKAHPFKACAIAKSALDAGLKVTRRGAGNAKEHVALRVADRLIQTWSKNKLIKLDGQIWTWKGDN